MNKKVAYMLAIKMPDGSTKYSDLTGLRLLWIRFKFWIWGLTQR